MFRIAICDDVKAVCDDIKSVILSSDKLKNGELHIDVFNNGIALIEELKDRFGIVKGQKEMKVHFDIRCDG